MSENLELQTTTTAIQPNSFSSKEAFEHIQRVATMFSKSEIVPKRYQGANNIGNCIIALEMANRMGASPIMVMQNLDIIMGRPAWSSTFLIASLNSSGKFSSLRYEESQEDGGKVRAWAYEKDSKEKVYGAWVSMNMAKQEGWVDKSGSKWKTMPELMMRYRAASFFVKQFAPEVSMGLQTIEEVKDFEVIETTPVKSIEQTERDRAVEMINNWKTLKDAEKGENSINSNFPDLFDMVEKRKEELRNA